jgi:sugar phosphate isomerase/epimerase
MNAGNRPALCWSHFTSLFHNLAEVAGARMKWRNDEDCRLKFAICNELYEGWPLARICRSVADLGYTGLEIAPYTLAACVTDISATRRAEYRRQAIDAGIKIIGLHWLLAGTTGFHLNDPDSSVRRRTAEYLAELVHCCADLGGELMVFGSPAARQLPPGVSMDDAFQFAADTIRRITDTLTARAVDFCIEPLASTETDFIQTANDAVRLIRLVDHPRVLLHLDVKAMSSEPTPIPAIIRAHAAHLRHFHANDANRRGPGMGEIDFVPIFCALRDVNYDKWVSVEVFDFSPDPETIARESIAYMRRCLGN